MKNEYILVIGGDQEAVGIFTDRKVAVDWYKKLGKAGKSAEFRLVELDSSKELIELVEDK